MLEQGNPELNVGDPGVKRQRKALGNPDFDFSETREGVRRIQNDSKENSKEDTDSLTAFANGWMEVIRQAFADEDPLFKDYLIKLQHLLNDKECQLEMQENII